MALTSERSLIGPFSLIASVITFSTVGTIEVKAIFPAKNAATASSLAALKIAGAAPPCLPDSTASWIAGKRRSSTGAKSHC